MADWIDVAPVVEFPEGSFRCLEVDAAQIAVFHLADGFFAIEDVCTHDGGILTGGVVEGSEIVCPRHGARFDLKTGEALEPPAYEAVDTLPVRVADGVVQVMDDRWQ
ncbi:MAG TPA: non-heme iron oxygenase ferredoxin subunit [bacterium]|jgi:3-phenylpropionate/trans-cinnamate dioxygenase ferredoxin subunit